MAQFLMKRCRTTRLETFAVSLGTIPRAAGAAAVEAYIMVSVTQQELSKSLTSFKHKIYLRLNVGIYLGSGKKEMSSERYYSIIYHLCFSLHNYILIQVMNHFHWRY